MLQCKGYFPRLPIPPTVLASHMYFFLPNSLVIFSIVNSISFFTPPFLYSCPFPNSLPQFSRLAPFLYPFPFSQVNVCLQNLFPYCYSGNPPKLHCSRDRLDKSFVFLLLLPVSTSFHLPPELFFCLLRNSS